MIEMQQAACVEGVRPPADQEADAWPDPREDWARDEESRRRGGGEQRDSDVSRYSWVNLP